MDESLPVKTQSVVSAERVQRNIESRFNPLRGLDPVRLAMQLDNFHAGCIAEAAKLWDAIERRDTQVQTVVPKRKRATALLDFQILTIDESPEAAAQKEFLKFFYDHVDATAALDQDQHGGFSMLVEQMMDAVGKQYAVHEILWKPVRIANEDRLTAQFISTPLWFFEHRTGKLRFLPTDYTPDGISLDEGGWLITSARVPLMEATSVAYMFKGLSLKDWLIWSERYGQPYIHGKTSAAQGSREWNAFHDALAHLDKDLRLLTNAEAVIDFHDLGNSGERPQQPLVEYMDTAITTLWRGGDLSTRSKDATGASQQGEERENIEEADATMVSEALNHFVDKPAIAWRFGADAPALAYVKVVPKPRVNVERDLTVWDFATAHGIDCGVSDFCKHFNLPPPGKKDTLLTKGVTTPPVTDLPGMTRQLSSSAANSLRHRAALRLVDEVCAANAARLRAGATADESTAGARRLGEALQLLLRAHDSASNSTTR